MQGLGRALMTGGVCLLLILALYMFIFRKPFNESIPMAVMMGAATFLGTYLGSRK